MSSILPKQAKSRHGKLTSKHCKLYLTHISTKYLMMVHGYVNWIVKNNMESAALEDNLAYSGCSTGICPADPRAEVSQRTGRKCWQFKNTNGDVIKEKCLTVKCSTCN